VFVCSVDIKETYNGGAKHWENKQDCLATTVFFFECISYHEKAVQGGILFLTSRERRYIVSNYLKELDKVQL
jgi:hypothetical protein